MKRCPSCQKVFEEDKKFCQVDGTPLIDMVETPPDDPFKTVVGAPPITSSNYSGDDMKTFVVSAEEKEDLLQIPEAFDPMKTMVVSEPIKPPPPPPTPSFNEPVVPAPPKFNEPSLSPPSFSDLSPVESSKVEEPPKFESPFSTPVSEPSKVEAPIANPFNPPPIEPPKFEATPLPSESSVDDSPFNKPVNPPIPSPFDAPPPPPFKDPEPLKASESKPVSSPFDQPATPFGQANDPFANQQQESTWNPPPAPVQGWQDQSVGQDTPFQPPVAGAGGQNNSLAVASLVLGILSFFCLGLLGSIPALITGYMQKGKIKSNPAEFGGGTMATIGMVLGGLNIALTVIFGVLYIILVAMSMR